MEDLGFPKQHCKKAYADENNYYLKQDPEASFIVGPYA
jgi:hypothetical protein